MFLKDVWYAGAWDDEIIEGKHDEVPESAFFLKGTIDEVVEAARS